MDREGGYKEIMRKFSLHFLILSPFPLRFLFISSFSLHFLAARLQGCNDSCSPGVNITITLIMRVMVIFIDHHGGKDEESELVGVGGEDVESDGDGL